MSKKSSSRRTRRAASKRVNPHRAFDLAIRFLLSLTFALMAGFSFRGGLDRLHKLDATHIDAHVVAQGFSILAIGLYTLMIACLYILRLRPTNKFAGAWPCAAAILGGFLMSGLLLLNPRTDLPLAAQIAAS